MFGTENVESKDYIKPNAASPTGRVEGCFLVKMHITDYEKNGVKTKVLNFDFVQKSTGATFTHKEFDNSVRPEGRSEPKQKTIVNAVNSRMKHIMGRFMPEPETIIPSVPSWEAYIKQIGTKMYGKFAGKECALKIIYNNSDFSAFPMFPSFISTETHYKDFEINPDYDKLVKSGSNAASATPTMSGGSGAPIDDDPFGEKAGSGEVPSVATDVPVVEGDIPSRAEDNPFG